MATDSALVLFSGGQDSTVCLAWALERYSRVETIGFAYGQRHAVEMTQRPLIRQGLSGVSSAWGSRLAEDHVLALATLGAISETALTRDAAFQLTAAAALITIIPIWLKFKVPDKEVEPQPPAPEPILPT